MGYRTAEAVAAQYGLVLGPRAAYFATHLALAVSDHDPVIRLSRAEMARMLGYTAGLRDRDSAARTAVKRHLATLVKAGVLVVQTRGGCAGAWTRRNEYRFVLDPAGARHWRDRMPAPEDVEDSPAPSGPDFHDEPSAQAGSPGGVEEQIPDPAEFTTGPERAAADSDQAVGEQVRSLRVSEVLAGLRAIGDDALVKSTVDGAPGHWPMPDRWRWALQQLAPQVFGTNSSRGCAA